MDQLANVGDFCVNEECEDHGKLQKQQSKRNIKKYGHTKNGTQRYQCLTCETTFTETKGAIFYRRRTPMETILEVPASWLRVFALVHCRESKGTKKRQSSTG